MIIILLRVGFDCLYQWSNLTEFIMINIFYSTAIHSEVMQEGLESITSEMRTDESDINGRVPVISETIEIDDAHHDDNTNESQYLIIISISPILLLLSWSFHLPCDGGRFSFSVAAWELVSLTIC